MDYQLRAHSALEEDTDSIHSTSVGCSQTLVPGTSNASGLLISEGPELRWTYPLTDNTYT